MERMQRWTKTSSKKQCRRTSRVSCLISQFCLNIYSIAEFESQTGWRIDGKYDPLPDEMRLELRRILAPYNDMLFKYLGIDPYPEWTENMD